MHYADNIGHNFLKRVRQVPISRNKKLVSDQMLDALFRMYEEGTEIIEAGLRYHFLDFSILYEILPDAYIIKPSVSRSEAIGLFSQSLRECRREGKVSSDAVLNKAIEINKKIFSVPQILYTLWTKFRAVNMVNCRSFTLSWRGVKLRTAANLPAWLHLDEYFISGLGSIYPSKPVGYGYVIISCDDRDEARAVKRMMDALQLVLGLINLYETWQRHTHLSGRNWTEGKLWFGPNQFVFRKRVFCGDERIWYNPDYHEEAWNRFPPQMKRVLQVLPHARRALAALEGHPLCDVLVRAMLLLQDGFAARDSSHRVLRYWSALEQIYVEPDLKSRSNEKVIERAIFAESNPELSKWKLEHIARIRNDYVHAGGSGDDLHGLAQFLRELLARHIHHWIYNGQSLAGHEGLLSLVKLPSDLTMLMQMREMIDQRLTYLSDDPR